MDQSRWDTINRIFHAALEVDPGERDALVSAESSGDAEVLASVRLLLAADAEAGSYLEDAPSGADLWLDSLPQLLPGDVLCDRFRIVREVAVGGMGQVFEGFDTELGVAVALKVIKPEIAAHPATLSRFRQEVRLARRITHPNVCRTYDLERETRVVDGYKKDLVFLTMEYLSGETLAARLKRSGALPLLDALHFARQIVSALGSAHALGITHRDIKPGNFMICAGDPEGAPERILITDFGLAKAVAAPAAGEGSALSHPGQPVGTLAYMAPEQLDGGEATASTDIYALGLVLFEMVTGARAFPDVGTLAEARRRIHEAAPSPRAVLTSLPAQWDAAIVGCTQVDPAHRFQKATDVIAALDGLAIPPGVDKRPFPSSMRRKELPATPARRKALLLMAALVVGVALFVAGLRFFKTESKAAVAPGTLVYLAPVRNETGEKRLENVSELVQAGLTQSARINLLDPGQVGDLLQQMTRPANADIDAATAREIAMRAGAARVLLVTVSGSGGHYRLSVQIEQPDNTPARARDRWTKNWNWQSSTTAASSSSIAPDILRVARESSNWIRHEIGESSNDIARLDAPPEDVTTANWEALADYAEAQRRAARRDPEGVVGALQSAVQHDSGFALAYASLGDVLLSMNRATESLRAYGKALDANLTHRLTRKERDFIKGAYANDTQDYLTGEAAFRDYTTYYENDYNGTFFRAFPLRMLGRFQESIDVLQRAHSLDPKAGGAYIGLAYDDMLVGDTAGVRHAIAGLQTIDRPDEVAMLEGHLAFLQGRYDEAAQWFDRLQSAKTAAHRSLRVSFLARLAAERGDAATAIKLLSEGIEDDRTRGDHAQEAADRLDRAYLECGSRNTVLCLEDTKTAIGLDAQPVNLVHASALLGRALGEDGPGKQGDMLAVLVSLERLIPSEEQSVIFDVARLHIRGEVALAEGKAEEALRSFRQADTLESPITGREYLGRALVTAARRAGSHARQETLDQALDAYGKVALHPERVWYYSLFYPPGYLAREMKSYRDLASELHRREQDTRKPLAASPVLSIPIRRQRFEVQPREKQHFQKEKLQWEMN